MYFLCYFDLDPMTLTYELDLKILKTKTNLLSNFGYVLPKCGTVWSLQL